MKRRRQTREVNYAPPAKPEIRQTRRAGGDLGDKLKAYRDAHVYALFSSLGRLVRTPFSSFMTIAVLTIAIAIAAGFQLLVFNLQQLSGNLEATTQISLFLKDRVSDAEARKLAEELRKNPGISQVSVINKDQALAEFKAHSGFGEAIDVLSDNPLPAVITVLPAENLVSKDQFQHLQQTLQQLEPVDVAQMDTLWVERLRSMITVAGQGLGVVNTLLGFAVLFIAGNTIRQELHSRHQEVVIAKLVGATDGFIQRPFLYAGFWLGFISGVLAWFIVTIVMLVLWQSVEAVSQLYGGSFHLLFFGFADTLKLIGISSVLGVLASWVVLQHQLRYTVPE